MENDRCRFGENVLITGGAGFIGAALSAGMAGYCRRLTIVDNLNDYYEPGLKIERLRNLGFGLASGASEADIPYGGELTAMREGTEMKFIRLSIDDDEAMDALFAEGEFGLAVNLAAQAGVRYSLENPRAYIKSNVCGFLNILEGCRLHGVRHLVYASSSSVYGLGSEAPFSETENVDRPASVYAATKKSDELLAHVYSHLYSLPTTGLRFFTVYGPWGRPDMAPFLFAEAITSGKPIHVFNHGDMMRDFTYIDDIVEGIMRVCEKTPERNVAAAGAGSGDIGNVPYKVYNIGNCAPVKLMDFIRAIENAVGCEAKKIFEGMQPGDVPLTYADCTMLQRDFGFSPATPLEEGVAATIEWFRAYLLKK